MSRAADEAVARGFACLAIDPGATSGWAVMRRAPGEGPVVLRHGLARNAWERRRAVDVAVETAGPRGRLVVVAETWAPGWAPGRRSHKGLLGMGAAWGRWAENLELAGVPRARVVRVRPDEWRPDLGLARRKAAVVAFAAARWGEHLSEDECEALAIGLWACKVCSSKVAEAVGRPIRSANVVA